MKRTVTLFVLLVVAFAVASSAAYARQSTIPARWKNCKAVNKRYPHGVGRYGAHDKTTGVPVTNFKHSTRLYKTAMHYNKGLDRDHDGIACEKH